MSTSIAGYGLHRNPAAICQSLHAGTHLSGRERKPSGDRGLIEATRGRLVQAPQDLQI
jgi:hypothetical protein